MILSEYQPGYKLTKGKTIAIVGASGAGKSTLVDLIPRFHDVDSGSILIDGVDIKEYKIEDVRKLMGIVSQEPILFNDSLQNNIALGHDFSDDIKKYGRRQRLRMRLIL
jgi:subfamily B ATP-binding cassette protein MsbA